MTGHSAAIAGLTSCAASATVASKSFFMVSSYAETNGGCEQKLLSSPTAARPQLPGICHALASDSRSAFGQQGLCEMWPTIASPKFDTPVRLRVRGKQGVMPFKGWRPPSWVRVPNISGAGSSKACFRIQRAQRQPRPLSGPSSHVSCKMRLSCFA